jgi:hypothetical protein
MIFCLILVSNLDPRDPVGKRNTRNATGMRYLGKSSRDVPAFRTMLQFANISLPSAFAVMSQLPLMRPLLTTFL